MHTFSFIFVYPQKKKKKHLWIFLPFMATGSLLDKKLEIPGCNIINENTQQLSSGWLHSNAIQTDNTKEENGNYELFNLFKTKLHFSLSFLQKILHKSNKVCKYCSFSWLIKITKKFYVIVIQKELQAHVLCGSK